MKNRESLLIQLLPAILLIVVLGLAMPGCKKDFLSQISYQHSSQSSNLDPEMRKKEELQNFYNNVCVTFLALAILFFFGWFLIDAHIASANGLSEAHMEYRYSEQKTKLHVAKVAADYSRTNRPRKYEPANDFDSQKHALSDGQDHDAIDGDPNSIDLTDVKVERSPNGE